MLKREVVEQIKCRFGCDGPIGLYHIPEGCICWPDPVQALCQQHVVTAESGGPIRLIVLLATPNKDKSALWADTTERPKS